MSQIGNTIERPVQKAKYIKKKSAEKYDQDLSVTPNLVFLNRQQVQDELPAVCAMHGMSLALAAIEVDKHADNET
jgi:hypothetical protein